MSDKYNTLFVLVLLAFAYVGMFMLSVTVSDLRKDIEVLSEHHNSVEVAAK